MNETCDMPMFSARKAFCKRCAITGRRKERWQKRVLGVPEFIQAINELAPWSHGITLCCNEPLYQAGERDDFRDISLPLLEHMAKIGLPRAIVTTGFRLAQNRGALRETETEISVSCDGPEEINDHEDVRGGFRYLMENLDQSWRDLRGLLAIATVVRKDTIDHLEGLLPVLERYEIEHWALSTFIDYGAIQVVPKLSDRAIDVLYTLVEKA